MNPDELPLRDIHLPEPVSWWPPAPGWWLLAGLLLLLAGGIYIYRLLAQKKRLRETVLAELERIRQQHLRDRNDIVLAQNLSSLLRRASISFYPREDVASLTGEDWLAYLDRTSATPEFDSDIGKLLVNAPYQRTVNAHDDSGQALLDLCENWLRAQPVKRDIAA